MHLDRVSAPKDNFYLQLCYDAVPLNIVYFPSNHLMYVTCVKSKTHEHKKTFSQVTLYIQPLSDLRKSCIMRNFTQVEFYVSRNFP
jgi:hypothetical protein